MLSFVKSEEQEGDLQIIMLSLKIKMTPMI